MIYLSVKVVNTPLYERAPCISWGNKSTCTVTVTIKTTSITTFEFRRTQSIVRMLMISIVDLVV